MAPTHETPDESVGSGVRAGPGPAYADHFRLGSLYRLWRTGHPYDFSQTYELMTRAFGYDAHYVNFGYWPEGAKTAEAGREMTWLMGQALGMPENGRLLEGGSGLGQTSVDLVERYRLSHAVGMNPCTTQVGFANALARHRGLGHLIHHRVCDATEEVHGLEAGSYDGAIAVECIGIFPEPRRFLEGVHRALRSGGRVCFTVVTTPRPAGWFQHNIGSLFFGTRARPPRWWTGALEDAGFQDVVETDITQDVFPPMIETVRKNLREEPGLLRRAGPVAGIAIKALIHNADRAVVDGTMAYEMFVAQKP